MTYARCGRLHCHACLVPAALDHGAAISLARPNFLVTLTQVGAGWPEIKTAVHIFARALRSLTGPVEFAYHIEANPRDTGNHAHMWARARAMGRAHVAVAAQRAHLGEHVHVQPVAPPPDGHRMPGATYGMKACLERPDGVTALWPAAQEYLALNGNRLEHHSRDFFRNREDRAVGVREAISEARAAYQLSGGWVSGWT